MRHHRLRVVVLGLALCCVGCSSNTPATVEGTLLVDGQPAGGYELQFISTQSGTVALAASRADGNFNVFIGRGNKEIAPGTYKVWVSPSGMIPGVPKPTVKLPEKYLSETTTDLVFDVKPGKNVVNVELQTAK